MSRRDKRQPRRDSKKTDPHAVRRPPAKTTLDEAERPDVDPFSATC